MEGKRRYQIEDVTGERNQGLAEPGKRSLAYVGRGNNRQAILDVLPHSGIAQLWFNFNSTKPEELGEDRTVERDTHGRVGFVEFRGIKDGVVIEDLPISRRRLAQAAVLFEEYRAEATSQIPQVKTSGAPRT